MTCCRLFVSMQNRLAAQKDVVVFYRLEGDDLTYFSPAQVSRYLFGNTVPSLLGEHAPGICGTDGKRYRRKFCFVRNAGNNTLRVG